MDELNRVRVRTLFISVCLVCISKPIFAGGGPQPLPAYADVETLRADSALTSVAFADPRSTNAGTGIAVGDRGVIFRSTDRGETWNVSPTPVDCRLEDIVWLDSNTVVVVGGGYDALTRLSRGVVLVSRDAGASFRQIRDHDLPRLRYLDVADDRSVLASGDWSHAQLSNQFVSRDGGQSWQGTSNDAAHSQASVSVSQTQSATSFVQWQQVTGVPAPIRDAVRISSNRLCAVGDHGVILTSDDDGESWIARRGDHPHAAILFVAGDAQSAPWSLLGSESLQWRNRSALLVEQQAAPGNPESESDLDLDLIRQAAMTLGGSSVDWFRGLDESDEPTDLQARRWIAIHRPAVVVIDESVSMETRQAFFQAAASMGVARVLKVSRTQHGGSLLHQSALLPRIGLLASDLTLDALHWVSPQRCEATSLSLTRLYDSGSTRIGGGGESVMAGLSLNPANQLSGNAKSISRHRLQVVQARMKQSKLVQQMFDVSGNSPGEFQQSLRLLMDQTAVEDQLRLLWSIRDQANTLDQALAAQAERVCLNELAKRFKNQSIGGWASIRLQAYQRSAEQRLLRSVSLALATKSQSAAAQPASVAISPFQDLHADTIASSKVGSIQQASAVIPVGVGRPEVIQASPSPQAASPTVGVDLQLEFHPAVMISRLAAETEPLVSADPLSVAGAEAAEGLETTDPALAATVTTDGDIQRIVDQGTLDWRRLLREYPSQGVIKHTDSPPRLDGKLNDACWANEISSVTQGEIQLRFSIDSKYLYVAAVCPAGAIAADPGNPTVGGSARDQFLSDVGRLRLRLDTDGDLWTSHCIEVTDAGRTRDAVDGDTRWQPTWYVDARRTEQSVTFEIAIRRSDLAGSIVNDSNARWFVSAETMMPGQESSEPLFPQPDQWRPVRMEPKKLSPAGPVRLAPVNSIQ